MFSRPNSAEPPGFTKMLNSFLWFGKVGSSRKTIPHGSRRNRQGVQAVSNLDSNRPRNNEKKHRQHIEGTEF